MRDMRLRRASMSQVKFALILYGPYVGGVIHHHPVGRFSLFSQSQCKTTLAVVYALPVCLNPPTKSHNADNALSFSIRRNSSCTRKQFRRRIGRG